MIPIKWMTLCHKLGSSDWCITFYLDSSHLDTSAVRCQSINGESWNVIKKEKESREIDDCKSGINV